MNKLSISEAELHAYVDRQLPESRRVEVEAYLASEPEQAQRVLAYQQQNEALRRFFEPVIEETPPAHLLNSARHPPATVNPKKWSILEGWSLQRLAAGVLIALLGGAAGWLGHGQFPGGEPLAQAVPLPRQAAVAHAVYSPDVRRPVEVAAEQEEQLVKWLSKRLGTPVSPPRLGAVGYELIGGRLLPGNTGPVAQFMYHDSAGQRLTLYVTTENTASRDTGFRFAREGAVNVFYWVDGKFGYALSASVDKGELARVATAVYDQLEHK